jgi:hypothetical protein
MRDIKKFPAVKIFIFCFSLIIINNYCFPWILGNGATGGYNEDTQLPGIQSKIPMEILLIEGAGYFLKTQSNVQTLLHMVELQDIKFIDYFELNQLVNGALINIIKARLAFEELIKVAEATPYKLDVIDQLNRFDYDAFLNKHCLNPFIFGIVRDYLNKGDITGTFKYLHERLNEIEQLLLIIRQSTTENCLPELPICWRLNERCAETALFGSYIARIFKVIK